MLTRLRILQVGDVHLKSSRSKNDAIDDKRQGFPRTVKKVMTQKPIKKVFRDIYKHIEGGNVDCLLFMGDFADKGDLSSFDSCVKYISNSLQLGTGRKFESLSHGIVPGNHDINRDLAITDPIGGKFKPLVASVKSSGMKSLPIKKPIWIDLVKDSSKVKVSLLNSCWGCGANEHIPLEFRDEISRAIDEALKKSTDGSALQAYYERQLDTPAFSDETIQCIVDEMGRNASETVLVAVAHHNLLPQQITRLAPYTELVNGGVLRKAFIGLARPILYLHGHIHDDPVEVISNADGFQIISISAPEAASGYNMIEIDLSP